MEWNFITYPVSRIVTNISIIVEYSLLISLYIMS